MAGDHKDCPKDTPRRTNWKQVACRKDLGGGVQCDPKKPEHWDYAKTCGDNWVVPDDGGEPANPGSYKGYTNKWTYSNVAKGDTSESTGAFSGESAPMNMWFDSARVGCIAGFSVFALGILFSVSMIAVDMKRRKKMYEELIAEDLQKMEQMGLGAKMKEIDAEL